MYHPFFPSQIGKQTADQSKDEKLKKDMPPAIAAIQEATKLSAEASEGLSGEEQSAADKKKLLDGSSGKREGEGREEDGREGEEREEGEEGREEGEEGREGGEEGDILWACVHVCNYKTTIKLLIFTHYC